MRFCVRGERGEGCLETRICWSSLFLLFQKGTEGDLRSLPPFLLPLPLSPSQRLWERSNGANVFCFLSSLPHSSPSPHGSVWVTAHLVPTGAFWRTFHHDGKICPDWWGRGMHAQPFPCTLFTITYKIAVYAPAKRADTLTLFYLYPYVLCGLGPTCHLPAFNQHWNAAAGLPNHMIGEVSWDPKKEDNLGPLSIQSYLERSIQGGSDIFPEHFHCFIIAKKIIFFVNFFSLNHLSCLRKHK